MIQVALISSTFGFLTNALFNIFTLLHLVHLVSLLQISDGACYLFLVSHDFLYFIYQMLALSIIILCMYLPIMNF